MERYALSTGSLLQVAPKTAGGQSRSFPVSYNYAIHVSPDGSKKGKKITLQKGDVIEVIRKLKGRGRSIMVRVHTRGKDGKMEKTKGWTELNKLIVPTYRPAGLEGPWDKPTFMAIRQYVEKLWGKDKSARDRMKAAGNVVRFFRFPGESLSAGSLVFADEGDGKKGKGKGPSKELLQFVKEEGDRQVPSPKRKGKTIKLKTLVNYAFGKDQDPQVQKNAKRVFQKMFKQWLSQNKNSAKPSGDDADAKAQAKAKRKRYVDRTTSSPKLFSKRIDRFLDSDDSKEQKLGERLTKKFFNKNLKKFFKEKGGSVTHQSLKKELGISGAQFKSTMQALADAGIVTKAGKGKWTLMSKRDKAYHKKRNS